MEKLIWVPCAGTKDSDPETPKNHVGEVRRGVSDLSNIWLTMHQALIDYPGIYISDSHTRCPSCSAIMEAAVDEYIG